VDCSVDCGQLNLAHVIRNRNKIKQETKTSKRLCRLNTLQGQDPRR